MLQTKLLLHGQPFHNLRYIRFRKPKTYISHFLNLYFKSWWANNASGKLEDLQS